MSQLRTVYGLKPVLEAFAADAGGIQEVFLAQGLEGALARKILGHAEQLGILVRWISKAELLRRCGSEHHQGAVVTVATVPKVELEELMQPAPDALVLVADGVQDPRNLGALMRSTQFFGGNAVVVPKHGATGLSPVVSKASAGATERLPLVTVTNLSRALEMFQKAGYWSYGAVAEGGQRLDEVSFHGPTILVLGSEDKGIRPLVARHCDVLVTIPRVGQMESLNVAIAASVMLWEVRRQQAKKSSAAVKVFEAGSSQALDKAVRDH